MNSAVSNDVFLVPLRHLFSPVYATDLTLTESTVRGLTSFVGDQDNELLKYLVSEQSFRDSDWPLVLYGPTGTGKTALALSVISEIVEHSGVIQIDRSESKPAIFTAADFARRFKSAIETNSVDDFRERITSSSALLIDNIHQLADQPLVQDELIIIVDRLVERSIPVLFTCDCAPQSITGLSVQLSSRLTCGLSLSVQAPGSSARRELIKSLIDIHGFEIDEATIAWLATQLKLTVPKINQFLSQLKITLAETTEFPKLNIKFFERLFDQTNEQQVLENCKLIIQSVADEYHLKPADLKSNSRKQSVVQARGIAIFLCRENLKTSFKRIGTWFGNRDHSTIMHSYNKTKAVVENEDSSGLKRTVDQLQIRLLDIFSSQINLMDIENRSKSCHTRLR